MSSVGLETSYFSIELRDDDLCYSNWSQGDMNAVLTQVSEYGCQILTPFEC